MLFPFGYLTSSCSFLIPSPIPRGHGSISSLVHGDYAGGTPGDSESAFKIMLKAPVNLIREESSLKMHQLNDSIVCAVVQM